MVVIHWMSTNPHLLHVCGFLSDIPVLLLLQPQCFPRTFLSHGAICLCIKGARLVVCIEMAGLRIRANVQTALNSDCHSNA